MNKVLVVAPHPDDETLGCGGTILRHLEEGDEVHWLIMTTLSEELGYSAKQISERREEIDLVSELYSFTSFHQLSFETTRLDVHPISDLISEVGKYLLDVTPDTIYIPYSYDIHSDHRVVFDVLAACTKSFRYPFIKRVRVYETLSETEFSIREDNNGFKPNLWVDISGYVDRKIEIMRCFKGEIKEHPFPRSERNIRALATLRGATAGVDSAEGFVVVKELI